MNTLKHIATISANKIDLARVNEEPFKHIVIDDFFPKDLLDACLYNFPKPDSSWDMSDDDVEKNFRSNYSSEFDFPPGLREAVRILNSSIVLESLSDALEIPKLIPDPYFTGGGLNISKRGGMLDVHVDGNYHDATGLNRRVNVILFLNRQWNEKWGGEFGIYDKKGNKVDSVYPILNRLVAFDTHDRSFHGTPDPIMCPKNRNRKSLILYYYTKEPRKHVRWRKPHSALWMKHSMKDKNFNTKRDYR